MKVALLTIFALVALCEGHVRLREPPNRSSVWRDSRFTHFNPQPNYDDDGLYCGRIHQLPEVRDCGICGDPWSDATPRPNEHGGTYGIGIITGDYRSGQSIPISAEFTAGHQGFFQMHICDQIPESEDCFKRNPLLQINQGGGIHDTKFIIPYEQPIWVNTTVLLPEGLRCEHCVLRLHYRAGNNWGDCGDGTEGMGCGYQETFRSCTDITIA